MNFSVLYGARDATYAMASASRHLAAAANDVGKIVVPVAVSALKKVPEQAAYTVYLVRYGETPQIRKDAAIKVGAGVLVVGGLTVATVGHFVSKYRKARIVRLHKKEMRAAKKREKNIYRAVKGADCVYSIEDINNEEFLKKAPHADKPGCFAIFTYDPGKDKEDMLAYRDVYVSGALSMYEGAKKQLDGKGNLYVHADVVYKRPMYVAFFPCNEANILAMRDELVGVLGADASYNAVDAALEIG